MTPEKRFTARWSPKFADGPLEFPVERQEHTRMTAQNGHDKLTSPAVFAELRALRSSFYDWHQMRKAPRCIKLLNGDVRVRRSDLDSWIVSCEEPAA